MHTTYTIRHWPGPRVRMNYALTSVTTTMIYLTLPVQLMNNNNYIACGQSYSYVGILEEVYSSDTRQTL